MAYGIKIATTHSLRISSRNIRGLRKDRGLAQKRLALEAGVDRTVVSKIERKVSNLSLEIFDRRYKVRD